MTQFVKYQHLERFGTDEVTGIELGTTYVFPKLDGTNGSVWLDENGVQAGSRNRHLSLDFDNAGFCAWVKKNNSLTNYLSEHPSHILYGEWLVPHTLKTYRDDAWNRFYIFDVFDVSEGRFLSYNEYANKIEDHSLDYLSPIGIVKNGTVEIYNRFLEKNTFAIKDGMGFGEGIVIKNYDYQNKFGRVVWAKIISSHFKDDHLRVMGAPVVGEISVEERIVNAFVTQHLVDKVQAKIVNAHQGWNSKMIPQLLGMVWHDLITEEMWEALKKFKNPKIDFAFLNRLTIAKIKELKPEVF